MLVRNVILNGSYQRFGKAYHINEWVKWVRNLLGTDERKHFSGTLCPLELKSKSWQFCPFMKTQLDSRAIFLTSSGSKENEPKSWCLSVTKASHLRRTWYEFPFCAPHLLRRGLSVSPVMQRYLFVVIHPVRRPVYKHPGLRLLKTNIIVAIAR